MRDLQFLPALSRPQEAGLIRGRLAEASGTRKLTAEAVDASLAVSQVGGWEGDAFFVFFSEALRQLRGSDGSSEPPSGRRFLVAIAAARKIQKPSTQDSHTLNSGFEGSTTSTQSRRLTRLLPLSRKLRGNQEKLRGI